MKKSIIFDMDGTLVDSSYAMTNSINHVRESIGLEKISQDFLEYHINAPDQNLPKLFYGTDEYDPIHKKLFYDHYMDTISSNIRLYDGIFNLLSNLKSKGFILSVATNASSYFAINILKATNIFSYFDLIVGANMVKNPKPAPDILEYICDKTSIKAHESILIGDSKKDEFAAKNTNMDFIFVHWGYGENENSNDTFTNTKDLGDYLLKL